MGSRGTGGYLICGIVRDTPLTPVADRLGHRDADVPRRVFDRVDHGFDTLADHDCFDLDHEMTSLRRSRNTVSRQIPSRLATRSRVPTMRNRNAVQCQRRTVLGEDRRLDRPDTDRLRAGDQLLQQRPPDPEAGGPRARRRCCPRRRRRSSAASTQATAPPTRRPRRATRRRGGAPRGEPRSRLPT